MHIAHITTYKRHCPAYMYMYSCLIDLSRKVSPSVCR